MPEIRHIFKRAKKRKWALFASRMANKPPPGFWVVPLSSIYFHQETEIPAASKQGNSLVILDLLETREYIAGEQQVILGGTENLILKKKKPPILILSIFGSSQWVRAQRSLCIFQKWLKNTQAKQSNVFKTPWRGWKDW